MDKESLIPVRRVCRHYEIEVSFVDDLYDLELIELTRVEEEVYIHNEAVSDLERLVRLHQDLNINIEGLGAVSHLLHKVNALKEEVRSLKHKVRRYERERGDLSY